MNDTSYNPGFAPFAKWAAQQAPVPASVHNLPATVAAGGAAATSLIVTEGFTLISAGITSTQNGTVSIQRYLDAGGTVPQAGAVVMPLSAGVAANIDVVDGRPFASFTLTVTNGSSSAIAALGNFALLLQASAARAPNPTADGSTTIAAGGTAQNLFSGAVPGNGYAVFNPDSSNDLWVSDSAMAAASAAGSIRVGPLSYYATEGGQKPMGAVSVYGAVTGQKITGRSW